jgi:predicted nucleic acid-binding protein
MVVLDSSALIPLARIGGLDLLYGACDDFRTVDGVVSEVLVPGKPGTAPLESFLADVEVHEAPDDASHVADLEGIAETDAAVVLLASKLDGYLLANDRALITVARSHGVECDWVTTLLLRCTALGLLGADEAKDVLYELVDTGMNLDPRAYVRVQDKLDDLD